ncbi:hypothetical protein DERP_007538, partial [Dermatophagoides pteronyssinus]
CNANCHFVFRQSGLIWFLLFTTKTKPIAKSNSAGFYRQDLCRSLIVWTYTNFIIIEDNNVIDNINKTKVIKYEYMERVHLHVILLSPLLSIWSIPACFTKQMIDNAATQIIRIRLSYLTK